MERQAIGADIAQNDCRVLLERVQRGWKLSRRKMVRQEIDLIAGTFDRGPQPAARPRHIPSC